MERYIGLDVHAASCTMGVLSQSGKRVGTHVVETSAKSLIALLDTIPGRKHVCLEEGTMAGWLYEVLSPHMEEVVVAGVVESRGPKSDKLDAFGRAEELRIGAVRKRVYKERGSFAALGYRAKVHDKVMRDSVRVMARITSLMRSRGVRVAHAGVYSESGRKKWIAGLPEAARYAAEILYAELDALMVLRAHAEKEMVSEARKHSEFRILKSCPGLGKIRAAQLMAVVVTPYRFASKRTFWSYCGLGIVMRSSSDWVRAQDGKWMRVPVQQTRGLTRSFNRTLKMVFKGAATTVISRRKDDPLFRHYTRLLDNGTKPNLARLTIARQIASIALSLWRNKEKYDPKKLELKEVPAGA